MEQNQLRELQKEEAIKRLNLLIEKGLFDETLKFFRNGETAIYENLGGCPILYGLEMNQGIEQYAIVKKAKEEFEKEYNSLVYMMSLTHTAFGTCYEMYYVSDSPEEWKMDRNELLNGGSYCYVYNCDDIYSSEIGWIGFTINKEFGGVIRTA